MPKRAASVVAIALTLLVGYGFAQAGLPVVLVLPDGTQVPFTVAASSQSYDVSYMAGRLNTFPRGNFHINVGGSRTNLPLDQVARADLLNHGTEDAVWRFTLKDGRQFDGLVSSTGAQFWISGRNQFGADESLVSLPSRPGEQAFIGVIFDPDAVAPGEAVAPAARADVDSVTLRNGDMLSGSILTDEFTVQASYGTLTFTSEQLTSIRIEDAAGKTDQFVLKVGDRVSGVLQNTTLEMTLTTGATITLEKGNIASITFATED